LGQEEAGDAEDMGERDQEPGVFGDDEGSEEVDFVQGVGDGFAVDATVRIEVVVAVEELGGAFDLDAVEAIAGVGDEVVAVAVSVGLGEAEAESGGFVEEGEFGELSAALGGEFALEGLAARGGQPRAAVPT
jgi:hypothetical protein